MDNQIDAKLQACLISKSDHLEEFVRRVYMQQGEWNLPWRECLLRQPQHDGRVFPNRIKHRWPRKLRRNLAEDVDTLRLQSL